MFRSNRVTFEGSQGLQLAARLDIPHEKPRAYALFAHCFTCSKDIFAARAIAAELARLGIAMLRFDFTGLGHSEGEFATTNFSSNIDDLIAAANYLRDHHSAPLLLVGHSLGGAAVLAAASQVPEAKAVVTIGAPADAEHVLHNFGASIDAIDNHGEAEVTLAGRQFTIQKHFLEDVRASNLKDAVSCLGKSLLVLHSPVDQIVGIENAAAIFQSARHPKSFVSLDKADHLLSRSEDAVYAARMIAAFITPCLEAETQQGSEEAESVTVSETGEGKFQNVVAAGPHRLFADEPVAYGGLDSGPSPYDLLGAALGACTSMTLRMYAERKGLELGAISVRVSHEKIHVSDCRECTDEMVAAGGKIDRFDRTIEVEGGVPDGLREKILEIADKCPVHRTLERGGAVATTLKT